MLSHIIFRCQFKEKSILAISQFSFFPIFSQSITSFSVFMGNNMRRGKVKTLRLILTLFTDVQDNSYCAFTKVAGTQWRLYMRVHLCELTKHWFEAIFWDGLSASTASKPQNLFQEVQNVDLQ